jgi:hypothetical protein
VVSSFFQRSLRRQLHDKASGEIVKAISAGQNMEVSPIFLFGGHCSSRKPANSQASERYLDAIMDVPPRIERHRPGDQSLDPSPGGSLPSQPDEGSIAEKEYESYEASHGNGSAALEKYSTPANALREKEGFFDTDSVNKELTSLKLEQNRREEDLR